MDMMKKIDEGIKMRIEKLTPQLNESQKRMFLALEEYELCHLRRELLFITVSTPQEMLFGGLVSVIFVCSGRVYGQICGQAKQNTEKNLLLPLKSFKI